MSNSSKQNTAGCSLLIGIACGAIIFLYIINKASSGDRYNSGKGMELFMGVVFWLGLIAFGIYWKTRKE